MLRMETRRAADTRDTSPLTNQSVVDEKDAAGEVAAVVKAMVEDVVVEAVVKVIRRRMTTWKPLLAFPTKSIKTCPLDSRMDERMRERQRKEQ